MYAEAVDNRERQNVIEMLVFNDSLTEENQATILTLARRAQVFTMEETRDLCRKLGLNPGFWPEQNILYD